MRFNIAYVVPRTNRSNTINQVLILEVYFIFWESDPIVEKGGDRCCANRAIAATCNNYTNRTRIGMYTPKCAYLGPNITANECLLKQT